MPSHTLPNVAYYLFLFLFFNLFANIKKNVLTIHIFVRLCNFEIIHVEFYILIFCPLFIDVASFRDTNVCFVGY